VNPDRTSVTFDYVQGTTPAPQVITATYTGTRPEQAFIGAELQGTGLATPIVLNIGATTATATLQPVSNLSAGTYAGTVSILVCADSACAQRIGGTPINITYTINVRAPLFTGPISIPLTYTRYAPAPTISGVLNVNAGVGAWTATASSPWIMLSQTSGTGAGNVTVSLNPAGALLPTGTYNGTVTLSGSGQSQSSSVSLFVVQPSITVGPFMSSFINGETIPPRNLSVTVNGPSNAVLAMTASTATPWLAISSATSSASPTANGQVVFTINPAIGPLASGTNVGSIRFQLGTPLDNVTVNTAVSVELLKPTISFTPASVVLGGATGRTFDDVPVTVSLPGIAQSYNWSTSAAPSWATLSRSSGSFNQTGQQIQLTPQRLQTAPGTSSATIRFTTQVNGDTVSADLPVSFNLDTHRLIASEIGVAFADVPTAAYDRLSHTVKVTDNLGIATTWTATSDQPWLNVTASGSSGDNLVLTASSSGLLPDTVNSATVTITTTDTSVVGPERIHVGLWVGSTTPSAPRFISRTNSGLNFGAANPVKPYAYMYENGFTTDLVRVFNAYTGEELPAITGLSKSAAYRDMFVSPDGDTLYVFGQFPRGFLPINLNTRALGTTILSADQITSREYSQFVVARPNGVGVLLDSGGDALLASNGANLGDAFLFHFALSGDNRLGFGFSTYALDFTSVGGGAFVRSDIGTIPNFSLEPRASNFDGSRVYAYQTNVWPTPQSENKLFFANGLTRAVLGTISTGLVYQSVAVTRQGRVLFIAADNSDNKLHILQADHTESTPAISIGAKAPFVDGLSSSGDDNLAVVVGDSGLWIVPIPR
jgi:hypothetical protein